jgi:hypothetical protein
MMTVMSEYLQDEEMAMRENQPGKFTAQSYHGHHSI